VKILVLGSGAREHAIVRALAAERTAEDEPAHEIVAAPGNPGIAEHAALVGLDPSDAAEVADFAVGNGIELVVIGPEAPLVAGVADATRERGIPTFGPGRAAAQIEGSKTFAKRVMAAAGVPTGRAVPVTTLDGARAALDEIGAPYVVKADGLAAGKGVLVTNDRDAALTHAETWLATCPVLVEEFLTGPEVSLFVVTDGHTVLPLAPAQDFKRLLDGDSGPNTGGMGAYSPLAWLPADAVDEIVRTVAEPTVRQLDAEGTPFIGLLYCGLVVTDAGIKVIEFNARFGDPETQVILARLTTPLSALLLGAATGTLAGVEAPRFTDDAAVTVVLASAGYPQHTRTGAPITGVAKAGLADGVHVLHAATARDAATGELSATGGRVLNVVAVAPSLAEARLRAYEAVADIDMPGVSFRTDIAARAAVLPEARN
jgi:phosphoribosylamine--glycine ligase